MKRFTSTTLADSSTAIVAIATFSLSVACKPHTSNTSNDDASPLGTGVDEAPVTPSTLSDRFVTCPVANANNSAITTFQGKQYSYKNSDQVNYEQNGWDNRISADWNALDGLVENGTHAVVIDIRRVDGKPAYLYLGSHGRAHKIFETWSSSKFIAAIAAISKARSDSYGKVGAEATVGGYHIGDMISRIHRYYEPFGNVSASSNSLGRYFAKIAGSSEKFPQGYTNWLFRDGWLRVGDESYMNGASYYDPPFDPKSSKWEAEGSDASVSMALGGGNGSKEMSALAMAEILKRLTQHEMDAATRMPGIQMADARVLFYGNPARNGKPGGMNAGVSRYIVQGLTAQTNESFIRSTLDTMAGSRWRVYNKMGWGDSTVRNPGKSTGESVLVGYACLPNFQGGREFVIVTRTSNAGQGSAYAGKMTNASVGKILGALKQSWGSTNTPTTTPTPTEKFPKGCKVQSSDDKANVRSGPASSNPIVKRKDNGANLVLNNGASVAAVKDVNGWYSVELRLGGEDYGEAKGTPAYISASLLICN